MNGHDRYLIYQLLGRHVDVRLPSRLGSKRVSGTVERVFRDIFDNVIEVTLNGRRHFFEEPEAIVRTDDDLMFLYGNVDDDDDEKTMLDSDFNGYQESIHEHIRRTSFGPSSKTVFRIGKLKLSPGARWRTRSAAP